MVSAYDFGRFIYRNSKSFRVNFFLNSLHEILESAFVLEHSKTLAKSEVGILRVSKVSKSYLRLF